MSATPAHNEEVGEGWGGEEWPGASRDVDRNRQHIKQILYIHRVKRFQAIFRRLIVTLTHITCLWAETYSSV